MVELLKPLRGEGAKLLKLVTESQGLSGPVGFHEFLTL
jgi:hypothetical protein